MSGGPYERKLVMTTNVAEASVTVDGIVFLIDSGRALQSEYDPRLQAKRLNKKWISILFINSCITSTKHKG